MKYIVTKIKKSGDGFNDRLDPAEERISEIEDMSIEIFTQRHRGGKYWGKKDRKETAGPTGKDLTRTSKQRSRHQRRPPAGESLYGGPSLSPTWRGALTPCTSHVFASLVAYPTRERPYWLSVSTCK